MLEDGDLHIEEGWQGILARDYHHPKYHISLLRAVGRRFRRNYIWLLLILSLAYMSKIIVHPGPVPHLEELLSRAALGPLHGSIVLAIGTMGNVALIGLALITLRLDRLKHVDSGNASSMG